MCDCARNNSILVQPPAAVPSRGSSAPIVQASAGSLHPDIVRNVVTALIAAAVVRLFFSR